jgi:hypothetical protein
MDWTNNKTTEQIVAETRQLEAWLKHVQPEQYPGYVNDGPAGEQNSDLVLEHILANAPGGFVTIKSLNAACDALYLRLHGLGVHHAEGRAAKIKAAADKVEAERIQKITESNQVVIQAWLKNECPLGLVVNGDLYAATQDMLVAFIRRNYYSKGVEHLTPAMLTAAVQTLGDALTWFDRSPDSMQLRNQPPPPPRTMSDRAKREAGMIPQERQKRADEIPMKTMQEVAAVALAAAQKRMGINPEQEWKNKAEAVWVGNRQGKKDHGRSQDLQKTFVWKDAAKTIPDWEQTYILRDKLATVIERDKNRI